MLSCVSRAPLGSNSATLPDPCDLPLPRYRASPPCWATWRRGADAVKLAAGEIVQLLHSSLAKTGTQTADDRSRDSLDRAFDETSTVLDDLAALLAQLIGAQCATNDGKVADTFQEIGIVHHFGIDFKLVSILILDDGG